MKYNPYTLKKEIYNFTARKVLPFIAIVNIVLMILYAENILVSILLILSFPLMNIPMVKLSEEQNKNFIDYSLTLTLIPMFFIPIYAGANAPGWLPAFSVLAAVEVFVINTNYRKFLQLCLLLAIFVSNYYVGFTINDNVIIMATLIIFTLIISLLFEYITTLYDDVFESKKLTQDSIKQASIIQGALIPKADLFDEYFDDYFIIWKPKDIVGGDIYFFEKLNDDEALLFIIDCTGHGVSGAFVTMIVQAAKEQIISNILNFKQDVSPSKILSEFNVNIKNILNQHDRRSISSSGFDGAIIYVNKKTKELKFSGSKTSLYCQNNGNLTELIGSRHSVGYSRSKANYIFAEDTITFTSNMKFYITTDGYIDQLGGEKEFPFGKTKLLEIINKNYNNSFKIQEKIFLNDLSEYQGEEIQNDDITFIAFSL